jgi:hypothetical protein
VGFRSADAFQAALVAVQKAIVFPDWPLKVRKLAVLMQSLLQNHKGTSPYLSNARPY